MIFDEIYHQADSAAYEAKKNGKRAIIFLNKMPAGIFLLRRKLR